MVQIMKGLSAADRDATAVFASGRAAWGCALVDCSNVMAKMSISTGIKARFIMSVSS